jgi:Flp pilus assembly protein TadG
MIRQTRAVPHRRRRMGAAIVELAVCLPVFVLLVFASIEACSMVFLRQAITAAAYEGARVAARSGSTEADALARCRAILRVRNVKEAEVSVSPTPSDQQPRGSEVTVSITVSCAANAAGPAPFYSDRELTAAVTMAKE